MFQKFIINLYNKLITNYCVLNCKCYQPYDSFIDYVFIQKNSYLCCVIKNNEVLHKVFPIMLGSFIDLLIRKQYDLTPNDCDITYKQFGSIIIDGEFKIIPNFITNNVNNLSVYRVKQKDQFVLWNLTSSYNTNLMSTSITECGKLMYNNPKKTKTLKKKIQITTMPADCTDDDSINYINSINPFEYNATVDEYFSLFEEINDLYFGIDELANKLLITSPYILYKVLLISNGNRLENIVKNGNMFFVLSKHVQDDANIKNFDMSIQKDYANIYMRIDGHKIDKICDFLTITKRSVTRQTRNSEALKYPKDAYGFICPLTSKEIKDAGISINISQYVIASISINLDDIYQYLKTHYNELHLSDVLDDAKTKYKLTVNGFITKYYATFDFDFFLSLKRKFNFIYFVKYKTFLNICVNNGAFLKYSNTYQIFINPCELQYFANGCQQYNINDPVIITNNNNYENNIFFRDYNIYHNLGDFTQYLPDTFIHTQPSKNTVTINNIKGSCNNIINNNEARIFLSTIGYNTGIVHKYKNITNDYQTEDEHYHHIDGEYVKRHLILDFKIEPLDSKIIKYPDFAVISKDNIISEKIKNYFENNEYYKQFTLQKKINIEQKNNFRFDSKLNETNPFIDDLFQNIHKDVVHTHININNDLQLFEEYIDNFSNYTITAIDENNTAIKRRRKIDKYRIFKLDEIYLKNYYNLLLETLNESKNTHNYQIQLYTAFGDLEGCTVEDGFIIDSTLVNHGPKKLLSTTLTIKLSDQFNLEYTHKNTLTSTNCRYEPIDLYYNGLIIFGVFISDKSINLSLNKRVKILQSTIGNHYYYFISYKTYFHMDDTLKIESFFFLNKSIIGLHFHRFIDMNVGWKLCNMYGQKGVVAAVRDLSQFAGYTKDGRLVKPQLLMSKQSVIGRVASGQVIDMLSNKDIAYTEDGGVISPLGYTVHYIEPTSKYKFSQIRNDAMTNQNGFDSNNMTSSSLLLLQQFNELKIPLKFVINLYKLNGININF